MDIVETRKMGLSTSDKEEEHTISVGAKHKFDE